MSRTAGFIERHGLWSGDQRRLAASIKARIKKDNLKLFRLAWADPHGAVKRENRHGARPSSPRSKTATTSMLLPRRSMRPVRGRLLRSPAVEAWASKK